MRKDGTYTSTVKMFLDLRDFIASLGTLERIVSLADSIYKVSWTGPDNVQSFKLIRVRQVYKDAGSSIGVEVGSDASRMLVDESQDPEQVFPFSKGEAPVSMSLHWHADDCALEIEFKQGALRYYAALELKKPQVQVLHQNHIQPGASPSFPASGHPYIVCGN